MSSELQMKKDSVMGKLAFLETEKRQLLLKIDDLESSLDIHKNIIKTLVEGKIKDAGTRTLID